MYKRYLLIKLVSAFRNPGSFIYAKIMRVTIPFGSKIHFLACSLFIFVNLIENGSGLYSGNSNAEENIFQSC